MADGLLEAVRGLHLAHPELGPKPLLAKLRQQQPDLAVGNKEVREALASLKAEESKAPEAAAAPAAAPAAAAPAAAPAAAGDVPTPSFSDVPTPTVSGDSVVATVPGEKEVEVKAEGAAPVAVQKTSAEIG